MCSISLHCIQVLCEVLFSVLPVYRVRVEGKKKMVHEGEETQLPCISCHVAEATHYAQTPKAKHQKPQGKISPNPMPQNI